MGKMGIDVKEYRPPWGHLNLMSLYCIRKMHLQLIFWDVMAQDWSATVSYTHLTLPTKLEV